MAANNRHSPLREGPGRQMARNMLSKTQRQSLYTVALFAALVLLLFGLASRLPAPSFDEVPHGVTPVDYSAFIAQVRQGNVLAVTVRGTGLKELLPNPPPRIHPPPPPATIP